MGLMEAYKKEPGGKEKLKERNPKWINDDYVKFIRMSEDLIARNPSGGVLGFITNHGYLDNPTFRGMRWHLLKTFDKIWVLDLHGNSNKKEVCPDGSPDKNVFDIMQGVALIVAARKGAGSDDLAQVWHGDLWGSRKAKNEALWSGKLSTLSPGKLPEKPPQYPFVQRDYELEIAYQAGFSLAELMPLHGVGMVTAHDDFVMGSASELLNRFSAFREAPSSADALHSNFGVAKKKGWDITKAHSAIQDVGELKELVRPVHYRPFDTRSIFYLDEAIWRPVRRIMDHLARGPICI